MLRLTVAILAGLAVVLTSAFLFADEVWFWLSNHVRADATDSLAITILSLPGIIVAALVMLVRGRGDRETRCRRCGYILRGISEPRCPECGERI